MGNRKRLTAFLLTAVMILTMPQMQIAAAEVESPADVGLCIHHTQHTEDCGYTEGEKETPCGHAHTEDCYAPMKQCVHEHGESCYPVAEDSASENTAEREPRTCTHECSEESGCITEKLDCRHEHNADCGYSPAAEGTPCTYECETCSGQEQINALPNVEDSPRENAEEIAALLAVAADPANKPTEGDGTEQSPYQITNAEELKWFRDTVNSGTTDINARLLHDIDLKNVSWEPIGTQKKPYNGTFDGNAYTIKNFRLGDHTKQDPISEKGLFGWIGSGGTIQDVVVKVESIGSATNPNNFNITKCGLIAAYNKGTIRRCSVMVNYTLYVAGEIGVIAYQNSGIIENCLSAVGTGTGAPKFPGRIPDEASAAGIAYENSGAIKNCLFDGELRTDGGTGNSYTAKDYAIAQNSSGGKITNCYYYHSKPRFGDAPYEGELYKDGDNSTVISKTQKKMGTGEVTWLLNEEGKNDIWRQRKIDSADISLNKSYGRVKKNNDGTYSIVTPHIHRLDNGTQTEFKEVNSLDEITEDTSNTKYYCLSENVTLSTAWEAPNRNIMLCLNGKSITASNGASAITVGTGSTFTLMDCGKGEISGGSSGVAVTGGTFNLHSGVISGNTTGVLLDSGTCTLKGGSITQNTTGVDYLDGKLTLSGGAKVIENKTKNILLHTRKTLSFGKLNADARFGISVENSDSSEASIPVTDTTGGKYFNNLFPDDALTNELYQENGVVWLRAQGHTAHCVCGGTHTAIGDHTQEKELNFQPWNPYAENPAKPQMPTSMLEGVDGYYLTQDVALNSIWSPSDVVLCLNGHKMTFSGNSFVEIPGNGKLTLTDCGTTGKLCREGSEVYKKGGISLSTGSTFDMYGGTITGFQHGVSTDQVGDMRLAYYLLHSLGTGTKVLFVGDANQLPSVGAGNVLNEMIASGIVPVTVLDMVFRQKNTSRIPLNAQSIQMGETKLLYGDDFQFLPADNAAEAAEIIKSEFLKQTSIYGVEHTQVLTPFRVKSDAGAAMLNLALQDILNPSADKRLEISSGNRTIRYRDKVMQTKNMETVSNGDIGFVSVVDKDADFPVTVTFSDNRIKEYSMDELGSIDLAYATTIHKSQGSEFDCVIIPVLSTFYVMLQRALIYTAITRAKKKVILVGQKRALFTAVHRNDTIQRNTILSKRIRDVFEKMKQKEQKAVKQEEVEQLTL